MKRLIANKALTARTRQCRVLKAAPSALTFRGAIGPDFHEWISSHWGFAGASLFSPARKIFLKPPGLPEFFFGQSQRPADVFNYTLLAQVQMQLALGVSNRMFFEGPTYVRGKTSAVKVFEKTTIGRAKSISREFSFSLIHSWLQAPSRDRERKGRPSFSFVTGPRWASGIRPPQTTHQSGVREIVGSSLNRFLHATQRWLEFLKVTAFRGAGGLAPRPSTKNGSGPVAVTMAVSNLIENEQILAWSPLVLRKTLNAAFKAGDQLSQHWTLPALLITPRAGIQAPALGRSERLTPLTLVVQHRSSKELEKTQTRFAQSSTMHFARHESQLVQKLVSTLKEARQTQTEIKTVAQPQIEIEQLTRQVYQQLEREIRIEKERRGF